MVDALQLDNEKQLLNKYYAGHQMESPNGGFLILLGVRHADDGSAVGIFECSVSSLRYELVIPKATRTERKRFGTPSTPATIRTARVTATARAWSGRERTSFAWRAESRTRRRDGVVLTGQVRVPRSGWFAIPGRISL